MDDFYVGEGTDDTGVPTKLLTVNCSLKINVYNSASMFGIHVTSSPIKLMYLEIPIATGQVSLHIPLIFGVCVFFLLETRNHLLNL